MAFILILHTFDKQRYGELVEYCKKAAAKDATFKFEIQADRIIIQNVSRDQAFKRGVLLHSRYGCFFEVLKQNQH